MLTRAARRPIGALLGLAACAAVSGAGAGPKPQRAAARPASARARPTLVLQRGHSQWITALAFCPDGRLLASGGYDGTVRLWDPRGRTLEAVLEMGGPRVVRALAFAPNGRTLAIACEDTKRIEGDIALCDVRSLAVRRRLTRPGSGRGRVGAVAYSPDGTTLAVGGDRYLWLVNPATGAARREIDVRAPVESIAFSPDGRTVAGGYSGGVLGLWSSSTGKPLRQVAGPGHAMNAVAFSPDGRLVVGGSGSNQRAGTDGVATVWEARTGRVVRVLLAHKREVSAVAFSPDGRTLATGSGDQTVKLWDTRTWQVTRSLASALGPVAFSPDGRLLATAGAAGVDPGVVRVWDPRTGDEKAVFGGYRAAAPRVAFSPDGATLASTDGRAARLWDTATGTLRQTLRATAEGLTSLAYSPDGSLLAGGTSSTYNESGSVVVWDMPAGAQRGTPQVDGAGRGRRVPARPREEASRDPFAGPGHAVSSVAFSPDGKLLAAGMSNNWVNQNVTPLGTVGLWDTSTGSLVRTLTAERVSLGCVAFSPDGATLASTGGTLVVYNPDPAKEEKPTAFVTLWDVRAGTPRQTLRAPDAYVGGWSVAFSPDGRTLALGCGLFDGFRIASEGVLWDMPPGSGPRTLGSGGRGFRCVAFSPDGKVLATGGVDGTVLLWDPAARRVARTLGPHAAGVTGLAWSSDGRRLAAGSADGSVVVWDAVGGRRLVTLVTLGDDSADPARDWIACTPEGWYTGSDGASERVRWRVGGRTLPPSTFDRVYRRPDRVKQALAGGP